MVVSGGEADLRRRGRWVLKSARDGLYILISHQGTLPRRCGYDARDGFAGAMGLGGGGFGEIYLAPSPDRAAGKQY